MFWQIAFLLVALGASLGLRPWRMLKGGALLTPMLATLVILPWLWALPRLHITPLHLQWSGACLVVLMLGWPLAIPVLCGVGLLSAVFAPQDWLSAIDTTIWLGIVPATLALLLGAAIRRGFGEYLFIYILGRAFLGTVACLFVTGVLAQWTGHQLGESVSDDLSLVARWLLAWGDGFFTGMLTAIFVAFKPAWLATWSDRLYLRRPDGGDGDDDAEPVAPALALAEWSDDTTASNPNQEPEVRASNPKAGAGQKPGTGRVR